MKREEYEKVCRAVYDGEERFVENEATHEKGRVHSCSSDSFNVELTGEWRLWARKVCAASSPAEGERRSGSSRLRR